MLTQVMCACPPAPQPVAMVRWASPKSYHPGLLSQDTATESFSTSALAASHWPGHKMKYLPFLVLFLPLTDTWGN